MYTPEVSFLTKLSLSRSGKIKEIETEFNIIKLAISIDDNDIKQKLISVPVRKLLLDNKNSLLLDVCTGFQMPELGAHEYECDNLKFRMPYDLDAPLINIDNWKNQVLAWYVATSSDIPDEIEADTYEAILRSLHRKNKNEESELKKYYQLTTISYQGDCFNGYKHCAGSADRIYELLDNAGYYKLTVYDFIKTIADKRGAHVDKEISPLVIIFNKSKLPPIECFAIQMIMQAKRQIPEFSDYAFPITEGQILQS